MKIVILDGYTVSQDDLSWSVLDEFAEVEVYDRTSAEDVVQRCKDAEMVLTNKVVLAHCIGRAQYPRAPAH